MQKLLPVLICAALTSTGCDPEQTTLGESERSAPVNVAAPTADEWPALAHVSLAHDGDIYDVLAFDASGEIVGRVGVEYADDAIRVLAEFADGDLVVDIDALTQEVIDVQQTGSLDGDELERRTAAMERMYLANAEHDPAAFEGWSGCALTILLLGPGCAPSGPWAPVTCGIAGAAAACACVKAANEGKAKAPCGDEKDKKK
jgi:hypothetical protein